MQLNLESNMEVTVIVIVIILIASVQGATWEEHLCDRARPEFSHTKGQPVVVPVLYNKTKYLDITWSTENILTGINCADAFEVEFQQVGGGRLTWSSWSAMVTCAPTKNGTIKIYHCTKFLNWRNCATRIRFRIIPHNSRNLNMKVRASPYEEVLIHCSFGIPSRVDVNRLSSGLYNKPLSPVEKASKLFVANSRDKRLRKLQESLERAWRNRRIRNERIKQQMEEREQEEKKKQERMKQQSKEKQQKKEFSPKPPPTSTIDTFTDTTTTSNPIDNIYPTANESIVVVDGATTTDSSWMCEYGEWSSWSNCTTPCGSGTKSRERNLHSGDQILCPFLSQTKSCFGTTCKQTEESSIERAVLLPGKYAEGRMKKGYEVRSNLKNFTNEQYTPLYCVTFQVESATRSCLKNIEFKSLQKGATVCSLCMKKSEESRTRCQGDGEEQQIQGFKLMLETRCFGTWKKIGVEQECTCEMDHSFLFV